MIRTILSIIAGFISWLVVWIVIEKIIAAIWPAFGVHQKAFEDAVKNGGDFRGETAMLIIHIVLGAVLSVMAGYLAAMIAGADSRAPVVVGILLLLMAIAKAAMSWQLVPIWYHIIFTVMLLPLAILGGRLITGR